LLGIEERDLPTIDLFFIVLLSRGDYLLHICIFVIWPSEAKLFGPHFPPFGQSLSFSPF
jgi:hypothetical protein